MAANPQYLVNQNIEQPKARIVPPLDRPQAVALQEKIHRIKVHVRTRASRPSKLLLGTINHAKFRVIKAIPINVESRGKTVIASWREVDEFGTGRSTSLACDDLGRTIAELYVSLKADEPRLGPDLANVWNVLRKYVVMRAPHESA
jgi:hypothetical protein